VTPEDLRFDNTFRTSTRREFELELEKAASRSHAARVGHMRCRQRKATRECSQAPAWTVRPEDKNLPTPTLYTGSSDPFTTFAIAADTRVVRALNFIRDQVLPAVYFNIVTLAIGGNPTHGYVTSMGLRASWNRTITSMHNGGTAWATLTTSLGVMALTTPDTRELYALALSLTSLRKSSCGWCPGDIPFVDHQLAAQLSHTFKASTYLDDDKAAILHGKVLRAVLVQGIQASVLDLFVLSPVALDDLEAALRYMRRLVLDYDWFASIATPFWSTIEELLPQPSASVHLATTTINHELRQFFILARWLNDYAENPVSQVSWARLEGEIPGGSIRYPGTKWICMMGFLLKMYFDLHEK
jgi:hypothetical protein